MLTWTEAFVGAVLLSVIGCRSPERLARAQMLTRPESSIRIDSVEVLVVGGRDGAPELMDVRSTLSAPDNSIAIADAGLHQVLIFDATGNLRARVGREGAGPGEFRELSLVAYWGDSVSAYDPVQRRLTFFTPDGTVIRQVGIDHHGLVMPTMIGFTGAGLPVLRGTVLPGPVESSDLVLVQGVVETIWRGSADTVARFDDGSWNRRGPRWFAWRAAVAAVDSGLWIGAGGTPEMKFVSWDGDERQVLHWDARTRAVSDADRAKIVAMAAVRRAAPDLTADDRFADSMPYFSRVLPGPEGRLLLVGPSATFESPDSAWVVDPAKGTIKGLALIAGFRPTQVARDHLLGVQTTEGGEIRVVRLWVTW